MDIKFTCDYCKLDYIVKEERFYSVNYHWDIQKCTSKKICTGCFIGLI